MSCTKHEQHHEESDSKKQSSRHVGDGAWVTIEAEGLRSDRIGGIELEVEGANGSKDCKEFVHRNGKIDHHPVLNGVGVLGVVRRTTEQYRSRQW